jgi:hypothetical protein
MMQARKDHWKALKQSRVAKEDLEACQQTQELLLLITALLDNPGEVQSLQLVLQLQHKQEEEEEEAVRTALLTQQQRQQWVVALLMLRQEMLLLH